MQQTAKRDIILIFKDTEGPLSNTAANGMLSGQLGYRKSL